MKKFNELIFKKKTDMNRELFQEYFKFQMPTIMSKTLYSLNDKKKNNLLVNTIKSGLNDLKNKIKKMSKEEREIKEPDKIVETAKEIIKFNEQQEGKGLKILTPNHILSRLPISLAQLQAGNNSQKLKNETGKLLYSLYHSKNLTKQAYNNLIKYELNENYELII